ncbi:hypothetical protein [Frankia gtarii]|uniref:hypothetical protein n=1 Tax=Frankia gtarii TaxID=2950102 RepID=UPI0021C0D868|nr:hypothetical protein [Frankia gtarii]
MDLFALLMATRLINPARQASNAERLGWLPRLERASRLLALATRQMVGVLEEAAQAGREVEVAAAWAAVETVAPRAQLAGAVAVVEELVPDDDGRRRRRCGSCLPSGTARCARSWGCWASRRRWRPPPAGPGCWQRSAPCPDWPPGK